MESRAPGWVLAECERQEVEGRKGKMVGPSKAMDRKGRNLKTHSKVPGKSVSGRCWRQAIFWDQVQQLTGQAIPVLVWPGHAGVGPKRGSQPGTCNRETSGTMSTPAGSTQCQVPTGRVGWEYRESTAQRLERTTPTYLLICIQLRLAPST